jgi:hypothetical protein
VCFVIVFFFVRFVVKKTGFGVKNSLQLAVDSCQEPVNIAKLEYWNIGFQTIDNGLTTMVFHSCLLPNGSIHL